MDLIKTVIAVAAVVSDRRLYFAEDERTVVEEGDPRAAFLAVGAGCETADPRVAEYLGQEAPAPAAVAQAAAIAPPAIDVKPVEKEQSPTENQREHEEASPTEKSVAEAVAEAKGDQAPAAPLQTSAAAPRGPTKGG